MKRLLFPLLLLGTIPGATPAAAQAPAVSSSSAPQAPPPSAPEPPPPPDAAAAEGEDSPAARTLRRLAEDGIRAFETGKFPAAQEAYRKVLAIDPDNIVGLVNLGATEFQLGNLTESEKLLSRSLLLKPDNSSAWLNLGIIHLQQENFMRALAAFAQAVVYAPTDPRARNYLGVAAGRNGWFDAAESELRRAIELRPGYADAHFNLAIFCLERDPPALELARRHYRKALELGAEPDPAIEAALKKSPAAN